MKREGVPDGGFVFVAATGLLATWWAYKRGLLQFRDVRVWLASHELVAQRCTLEKGRAPRFRVEELGELVGGVGGEHFRSSLRRLSSLGLVSWSETRIDFAKSLADLTTPEPSALQEAIESVKNHRRKVPLPRRLLRLLASSSRPVFVATALGQLLRCMYYRKGRCSPEGLCKASWIARVFEVDERNVKAARQELEALGVLVRKVASQYRLNRWGVPMRFNLEWQRPAIERQTPPREALSTTETPPLRETGNSSSGRSENQKPARPVAGVRKRTGGVPRLSRVLEMDLRHPARLLSLYAQARAQRLLGASEAERLGFFAAAEHALAHANRNPAGLFVTMVRRGLWGHLSLQDEDRAQRTLRALHDDTLTRQKQPLRQTGVPMPENPADVRRRIAASIGSVECRRGSHAATSLIDR